MENRMLRLGKNPPIVDSRALMFGHYLQPKLPAPPERLDWSGGVPQWPMYLNDRYGDCTCAAVGHMIEAWTASTKRLRKPSDHDILTLYEHFTTPGPENGCSMLDVLKYWRSHGLGRDRIGAFAPLERRNVVEVKDAIALFGGCYLGVTLPKFAVNAPDLSRVPWIVRPYGTRGDGTPDAGGGHCVNAVGYDSRNLYVVTWGAIKAMSWEFYKDYSDEAYAVLSTDFLSGNKTPRGFDLAQLQADIAEVGQVPASRASIMRLNG